MRAVLAGEIPSKAGQIASALNRSNTAKRYARQVLAIDPNNADAYMLIGDAIGVHPRRVTMEVLDLELFTG